MTSLSATKDMTYRAKHWLVGHLKPIALIYLSVACAAGLAAAIAFREPEILIITAMLCSFLGMLATDIYKQH